MKTHIKLSLLIMAMLLPASAIAYDIEVDGIYYNINGNEATVTYKVLGEGCYLNDYSGNIVIPKTITFGGITYSVVSIGEGAFYECRRLSSITIPNSVTSIDYDAFNGCIGLISITIPNSVTSIGGWAFWKCNSLTNITIPNSVTSIGTYAFSGCSDLTNIQVENGNPKYDSRNDCNAIIESANNTLVAGCKNTLIPNSITSIGDGTFWGCSGLTGVIIPNSVTTIGKSAFEGCIGLTGVTIPNYVTTIGNSAFEGCSGLTNITIPNSVTTIGNSAFEGCSGLTNITIPNSVTSIGTYAFSGCSGLTNIQVENGNPKYDSRNDCNAIIKSANNTLVAGCKNTLIPNSITSIDNGAFEGCSGLTNITIPNSVTSIGTYAFSGCSGLTNIQVENGNPKYDSRNDCNAIIESANNTLVAGCKNTLIPNSITSIGNSAFYGCSGLKSIIIPNSVTSIGHCVFYGCKNLSTIQVENGNPKYDSRNDCNAIIESANNTLVAGCKNTLIPNSVTSIGYSAFQGCNGLIDITIPNSVTTICPSAFFECTDLTNITISNSVTSIEVGVFSLCKSLASINIPNSVTSIKNSAFWGCCNLTSIAIPNSVTSIDEWAFYDCYNLSTLIISGGGEWTAGELPSMVNTLYIDNSNGVKGMKNKPIDVFSFAVTPPVCDENSFADYSGTLHVPAASLAAYFTAPYWCNFTNIVGDAVKPNGLNLDKDSIELIITEITSLEAAITPVSAISNIITWASSNPAVATVVNGQVTAVGYGECDIVAMCLDQRAVCHVTVYNDRISVDQELLQVQPNHIVVLTPTSLAAELTALVVTSSNPTVAAARVMNGKVQVVGVSEGTATITVSAADGTAKPATCLVTVYTEQGDTNGDGYIDIDDVTALIEGVLGNEATSIKEKNADLNDDGIMDIDDVTALINTILGNN